MSAFYHDAAAALVRDGEIVAAAQEERFSRKKRDPRFPQHAIDYCLEEAFIDPSELSAVVFYENLLLTFDRIVKCLLATAPAGREQWAKGAPLQLSVKMRFAEAARRALGSDVPVLYSAHHVSHAASSYFDLDRESPNMLLVAPVRQERQRPMDWAAFDSGDDDLLALVNQPRSDIPAVTHVDHSARVQTVHAQDHPEFHRILAAFKALTGCAVIVNTSFNVRGEPIVCSPEDAWRCFMRTGMDMLVLGDCLLRKTDQPRLEESTDWRSEYELD